jgi:hypothetical protein
MSIPVGTALATSRSAGARERAHDAGERYEAAVSDFGRLAYADVAPRWKDRSAARRRGTRQPAPLTNAAS